MTLRTSIIIDGNSSGGQKAVNDMVVSVDRLDAATAELGATERTTAAASSALEAELRQAMAAAAGLESELRDAREAAAALAGRVDILETQLSRAAMTGRANVGSMAQQRQGAMMLGQQFQDMGVQASMAGGTIADYLRIMAMQAGQTAYAIDQMGAKGALGATAAYLMTPWGAAVMAGALVLVPFITKLFETDDALKQVEAGSYALGDAQSVLSGIFDLNTGKVKANTEALILNARAKALSLRAEAAEKMRGADKVFATAGQASAGGLVSAFLSRTGPANPFDRVADVERRAAEAGKYLAAIRDAKTEADRTKASEQALAFSEKARFEGLKVDRVQYQQAIVDRANAEANKAIAGLIDKSLDDGKLAGGLLRDGGKGGSGRGGRGSGAGARGEFGRDAADTIAGIVGRYDDMPRPFQQAAGEIRKLDDLIDDLGRKRPPNFDKLIVSAEAAKVTVQQGLIRTVAEAFEKPETLADKASKAIGDLDDMLADLEKRKPPGFETLVEGARAAKGAIEDSLTRPYDEYLAAQEQQLEIQRLINAGREDEAEALRVINGLEKGNLPLGEQRKKVIRETVAELREEGREMERMRASQQKYLNALDDTRSILTGAIANPKSIAQAPEALLGSFKQLSAEYLFDKWFGPAFEQLQDEITGNGAIQRSSAKTSGALDSVAKAANSAANALRGVADPDEVVVTGKKDESGSTTPRSFLERVSGELLKGVGLKEDAANKIAKGVGKGVEGAFQGQMASGIASMLGIKQSSTGAAIGGALGGLTGLPGGSIIGGLLGGTIGALFRKAPSASAVITNGNTSVTGNNADAKSSVSAAAGSVADTMKRIADALGGAVGSYSVSIGKREDYYRVSGDGSSRVGDKHPKVPLLYNGKDPEEALRIAIANAISDGAITGVSARVSKALASSTDVDAALAEARKVADLETILGGPNGEMARAFKAFEAQAKDRLRLATTYGFDIVEVEKLNAKERLELTNRLMEQQVGSLQRLVTEMTSGSMFEGTKVEQRDKLLAEIATAKADLDKGVAGAADKLAGLFEQLNAVSKEVYGTTGGFATDRSAILDQARAAIAKANADLAKAQQQGSDPALKQTNAALDENNDQNAQILEALRRSNLLNEELLNRFGSLGSDLDSRLRLRELASTS